MYRAISSVIAAVQKLDRFGSNSVVTITVVDNSVSSNLRLNDLSSLQSGSPKVRCELRLIHGHGNIGYGRGQNLAYFAHHARYHLFINADVELDVDALLFGISYLESNPDVVIASPQAVGRDGSKQHLCKEYPTVLDLCLRGLKSITNVAFIRTRLSRYEMQELSEDEPTKLVPIISGCFMLCNSAAISRIGGFDPSYFLYFEDFDLSIRAREEGSLAYVPNMRIRHQGGDAIRKGLKHIKYFCTSGIKFFNKHGWKWI